MSTVITPAAAETVKKQKRGKEASEGGRGRAGLLTYLVIGAMVFLWVLPTLGILFTSFRDRDAQREGGWWNLILHPSEISDLTLENYTGAFDRIDLGDAFINSLAITLPATFIPILIAAFAAYAFTFMKFWGRDVLFVTIVAMLVVPNFVSFVPMLRLYRDYTPFAGQFPAVWLFHVGFGMSLAIYMLRNYMSTLPATIIESAKIDGASHFQTFWRLVLPMSTPALAAFAIFQFLWVWNDLLVALVFLGPEGDKAPMTVAISQLVGQQGQGRELVTAAGMFSMLIPIVVFLSLQRFFVRGLTAGAVKG